MALSKIKRKRILPDSGRFQLVQPVLQTSSQRSYVSETVHGQDTIAKVRAHSLGAVKDDFLLRVKILKPSPQIVDGYVNGLRNSPLFRQFHAIADIYENEGFPGLHFGPELPGRNGIPITLIVVLAHCSGDHHWISGG